MKNLDVGRSLDCLHIKNVTCLSNKLLPHLFAFGIKLHEKSMHNIRKLSYILIPKNQHIAQ